MKKTLIMFLVLFTSFTLFACGSEKNIKELSEQTITAESFFSDKKITLNILANTEGFSSLSKSKGFWSKLSIDEISNLFSEEVIYEKNDSYIELFSKGEFFVLRFVTTENDYNKYVLHGDYATFSYKEDNNSKYANVPFLYSISPAISDSYIISSDKWDILKDYYSKLTIASVTINENVIRVSNISNCEIMSLIFTLNSDGITISHE